MYSTSLFLSWASKYFRHVWQHRGDEILHSLHDGLLPDHGYATELPADIRQARTGVPAIDMAVRILYATGTLRDHARMGLASYVVQLRKVHWRVGADSLVAHLLDGDLASNHLSWQWVAGTGSSKPYLFNAENVARYAPPAWHSTGTVIDCSYETLDALVRSGRPVRAAPLGEGVEEPAVWKVPPRSDYGPATGRRSGGTRRVAGAPLGARGAARRSARGLRSGGPVARRAPCHLALEWGALGLRGRAHGLAHFSALARQSRFADAGAGGRSLGADASRASCQWRAAPLRGAARTDAPVCRRGSQLRFVLHLVEPHPARREVARRLAWLDGAERTRRNRPSA
jgi:FAD binding domain of DNA photolyase